MYQPFRSSSFIDYGQHIDASGHQEPEAVFFMDESKHDLPPARSAAGLPDRGSHELLSLRSSAMVPRSHGVAAVFSRPPAAKSRGARCSH